MYVIHYTSRYMHIFIQHKNYRNEKSPRYLFSSFLQDYQWHL